MARPTRVKHPSPDADPGLRHAEAEVATTAQAGRRSLRIITYNIHKCVGGLDRACNPERIRDAIAPYDADIVMLQEVVEGPDGPKYFHQVKLLGDLLNLRHRTFFPNVDLLGGARYGNAILSRFAFTETRNIDLAVPLSTRRSGLHARFRIRRPGRDRDARTVHVFNIHLGLTQYLRKWQLRKFLESDCVRALNPRSPVIIAGDFNDVWGSLGEKYLAPAGFRGTARRLRTFPAWAPVRALDSIYVRGDVDLLNVERPGHRVARWASDHLPLIGDLALR